MKIIIGLGDTEKHSTFNRKNIGLLVIDYFAETYGITLTNEPSFNAFIGIGDILDHKVVLVKPTNTIGSVIKQCVEHFNVSYDDILVIYDDINLPFDKVLFKCSGNTEDHAGIKDIISTIGTDSFPRLKYGVGDCIKDNVLSDYLHSDLVKIDLNLVRDSLPYLRTPIEMFVWRGILPVMNTFN